MADTVYVDKHTLLLEHPSTIKMTLSNVTYYKEVALIASNFANTDIFT